MHAGQLEQSLKACLHYSFNSDLIEIGSSSIPCTLVRCFCVGRLIMIQLRSSQSTSGRWIGSGLDRDRKWILQEINVLGLYHTTVLQLFCNGWQILECPRYERLVGCTVWGAENIQNQLDEISRKRIVYQGVTRSLSQLGYAHTWQQGKTMIKTWFSDAGR